MGGWVGGRKMSSRDELAQHEQPYLVSSDSAPCSIPPVGATTSYLLKSNFETVTFKSLNIALFYLLNIFTIVQTACTET